MTQKLDIDILARTIYGEARGEYGRRQGGISSLIAVANVIMNRLDQHTWYGHSIGHVCQKPWQFSCWNENDPNSALLAQETIRNPIFSKCIHVAEKVATRQWPDLTKGADHYHAASMPIWPKWARNERPQVQIGQHVFYKLGRG